ncbi:hypothetical protein FH972_013587 [Carpinus fangiana]|uniref:MATH domain-containing protein n=1 Tax=Carpinus fangiana TaxID=176857 RepID=A0A5N6R879_9ROSI|nr:hypothetical protein FH972_013587 [Carpinus fangiana]
MIRSTRDLPAPHYTFQIKNFSLLLRMKKKKCHSGQFEVDGYQWRLVLYPNGRKNSNGKGHISLYLEIADTKDFPHGWEVNVNIIRFFVFDQIRDKYLIIQDANGRVKHFHNLKTEWGFAQLLSHDSLNDSSNGYLFDDTCVFGVEVFVIKAEYWFSDPDTSYGYHKFLAVRDLMETSNGYLVDDALFIECKIDVISVVKDFF